MSVTLKNNHQNEEGCRGRDRMVVVFATTCAVQSVPITTKVVSSISASGQVYYIQHYGMKFDRSWFSSGSPSIKLTVTI